jgi:peroxiredoxin Q/BCP
MLEIGAELPTLALVDHEGQSLELRSLVGAPSVFFFYPRADTPGCTKEACAFRDLSGDFAAAGVRVFGVSADTVKKQASFVMKYGLTMRLLADTERQLIEGWGVWAEKTMYGKTSMGIVRSTFLFDAEGRLAQRWSPVKVDGHAEAVLSAASGLTR